MALAGVRVDDAIGALNVLIGGVLDAQSPAIKLDFDGVPGQADGTDGDVGSKAFLTTDIAVETNTGPESTVRGTALLELSLLPDDSDAYWQNKVAESLRGTLDGANLAVYGKVSGTPLVLQGVLNITNFSWQVISDTSSRVVAEVVIEIKERR